MWICPSCGENNQDEYNRCSFCGCNKNGSHFAPNRQHTGFRENAAEPRTETGAEAQPPRKSLLCRAANILGIILMILLPLSVLLFGVILYAHPITFSLLEDQLIYRAAVTASGSVSGTLLYIFVLLTAVLLSVLPGLWTCLLAKAKKN